MGIIKIEIKHFKVIACAVLVRECYWCASLSENKIDLKIVEQGLHDLGQEKMTERLQKELDQTDFKGVDAVLLAYGLCNNGICGLHAPVPLVVPRAHDCITLLLGSKERYSDYFSKNPGTFYESVGWMEQVESHLSNPQSTTRKMGWGTPEEMREKYGDENAEYLAEILAGGLKHYSKMTYIHSGFGNFPAAENAARSQAQKNGWEFEKLSGETRLLQRLMDGDWTENDFLVVPPGKKVAASFDETIVKTVLE